MVKMIDSHIHLDHYDNKEIDGIVNGNGGVEAFVSVSFHLDSCKKNLKLAKKFEKVKPAFGFHPEQNLPKEGEMAELFTWMENNKSDMMAVGEVGLPYYRRQEGKVSAVESGRYLELLEEFIKRAKAWGKPIVLHAVYDDAPTVCNILEKHSYSGAHFHWFKGDHKTIHRMMENGYYISVTPDVMYEAEIQHLAAIYPLQQLMVETDGPWPFEGIFTGKRTEPTMMLESIQMISRQKQMPFHEVMRKIYDNTRKFYRI